MTFTSLFFLFAFLPVSALIDRFTRKRWNNIALLVLSWIFYGWGGLDNLLLLVLLTAWNYVCAQKLADNPDKLELGIAVGVDLLVLALYKYLNPALALFHVAGTDLLLPTGLSFYLFSCLSALFDVYRKKAPAPDSFVNFGLYAGFFGWVNMGPVQNWANMQEQLKSHPQTKEKQANGAMLFLRGLFAKVILADNFGLVFAALSGNTTWLGNLLLGFAYFFQLYFDFSGYSKMARGIALWAGFEVPENFNLPYTATRVQEFWRRWHISLTSWFREYVYIPLGGNRVDTTRWILNILCVWILTGLWHGSTLNFAVWGLYQGALILLEKFWLDSLLKKLPNPLQHVWLVLTQLVGWTFFFSPDLLMGVQNVGRYFAIGITGFADAAAWFQLKGAFFLFVAGIVCSTALPEALTARLKRASGRNWIWVQAALCLFAFVITVAFLTGATNQTFLYAAF